MPLRLCVSPDTAAPAEPAPFAFLEATDAAEAEALAAAAAADASLATPAAETERGPLPDNS
eukprot:4946193-Alexandrium_andersonii.AAC.1